MPLTYPVKDNGQCKVEVVDGRIKQGVIELRLDYPTAFIGTPEFFPVKTRPTIAEVVRTEICAAPEMRKESFSVEISKLTCDAKMGFTRAIARAELLFVVGHAERPSIPIAVTHRIEIERDVPPGELCDKAVTALASKIRKELSTVKR